MIRKLIPYSLIIILLASCSTTNTILQRTQLDEATQVATIAPTELAVSTVAPTLQLPATLPFPTLLSPKPTPTLKPTATLSSARAPIIHNIPGEIYETLFSIPVGERSIIKFNIPSCCGNIEGPNAIAVLPDYTFLISDPIGGQLLNYDHEGHLLSTIKLVKLGIGYVRDLRVKRNEIYLLETSYQKFRAHRLTQVGELIASEEIPYQFPIDNQNSENTLEGGLTGIAIDCEERIILEVIGGSILFPLSEVQKQSDPSHVTQGLLCNEKRFFVSTPGLWSDPKVTAREVIYQTKLTEGLGGLNFLDLFQDGSFYLVRDDVMPTTTIKVDQTIHYIDENGVVKGVARVPLSEFYYPITRNTAVSPNGEVFALLPRPDSLDIIHLKFYQELEPLIPGAVVPQITIMQK